MIVPSKVKRCLDDWGLATLHHTVPIYRGTGLQMSYGDGYITIPRWQTLRARFDPNYHRSILHEYGHAYLDLCDALTRTRLTQVFGSFTLVNYPSRLKCLTGWLIPRPDGFVSGYATLHAVEDFAETFARVVVGDVCTSKKMCSVRDTLNSRSRPYSARRS